MLFVQLLVGTRDGHLLIIKILFIIYYNFIYYYHYYCFDYYYIIQLFVGTRDGHLLMYGVTAKPGGGDHNVQLLRFSFLPLRKCCKCCKSCKSCKYCKCCRSNKYFSKKAIMQLAVVPEYSILVALKEGMVRKPNRIFE